MRGRALLPLIVVAGILTGIGAWFAWPPPQPQPSGPPAASGGTAAIGGPFRLVDDTDRPVTEATLAGRPSVLYFGYTFCPDVCPTTLSDLARWMHALGAMADGMNFVFVTVDPARDTPQVLHDYVRSFDPRIRGFTGTPDEVAAMAKAYRVYFRKVPSSDGPYLVDHTSALYLIGRDGGFRGLIPYGMDDAAALTRLRALAGGAGAAP